MGAKRDFESGEWIVPPEEQMFITHPELGALLGVSSSTISKWVIRGLLPTVQIGKKKYVRRDLIFDWLDQHTHTGDLDELEVRAFPKKAK